MSDDYDELLAELEVMYLRLVDETQGPISGLINSYKIQTRDLLALLVPMLRQLKPPSK